LDQFDTIGYLKLGNMRQIMAYNTLTNHNVIELLAGYTPLLVGTIPIGIDIKGSDLDILCYWHDKETFISTLKNSFSGKKGFILKDYIVNDIPTVKTNFYIDDFEGAESSIDIRNFGNWFLASTPSGQNNLLREGSLFDDRRYNHNRAKINWHTIDPLFARDGSTTPDNVKNTPMQSNNFMRQIVETEIFPNKARPNGQVQIMPVLDLHFNPNIRGPYNYVVNDNPYAKGLNANGSLKDPRTRWGGIMRRIETNDFESANIDYIEFWMMDPFANGNGPGTALNSGTGGDFFINIGNISEDILRDGQQSFENGIPVTPENTNVAYTTWGKYPTAPPNTPRFTGSTSSIISMARIFGAPESVPAGNVALNTSKASTSSRTSPCTFETICITWE
jgi:hypothetical protein